MTDYLTGANTDECYFMPIVDDSLSDRDIKHGDTVTVHIQAAAEPGDIIVANIDGQPQLMTYGGNADAVEVLGVAISRTRSL